MLRNLLFFVGLSVFSSCLIAAPTIVIQGPTSAGPTGVYAGSWTGTAQGSVGQSITSPTTSISGFGMYIAVAGGSSTDTLTYSLRSGSFTGTVLASKTVIVTNTSSAWVDVFFDTPVAVTNGGTYYLHVADTDGDASWSGYVRFAAAYNQTDGGQAYPGGIAYYANNVSSSSADTSFRVYTGALYGFTFSAISGNTSENAGTATFTVVLDSQPTADVTLPLSSSNTNEGTVSPSSLTFTTSNWNTPQTVTVTGVDDNQVDGSTLYSIITGAATSADTNYNGLNPDDVSVTNADNDVAGITVSSISGNTSEAGTTATFTVMLNTQPSADVTIGLSSSDTTEGSVAPSSLTFTSANWNVNQTATVTGVDDSVVDGEISFSIITAAASSADSNYNGLDANDVNVTNTDNDVAGTDSNSDGILDDDALQIGLDPDSLDSDGDGIPDVTEIGDPNNPTDSDGDGIIDALEPGTDNNSNTVLAAFVTTRTAQALGLNAMGGSVLSIRSTGAGTLTAHPNGSRGIPLYSETDMTVADSAYDYPFGLMDYSVTAPGGTGDILIQLPAGVSIPTGAVVRKLGPDNRWVTIDATIDTTARTITLTLADNDSLDHNPAVGIIRDPVGIASATASGSSSGGGCTLTNDARKDLSLMLLAGMMLLLGVWRQTLRSRGKPHASS